MLLVDEHEQRKSKCYRSRAYLWRDLYLLHHDSLPSVFALSVQAKKLGVFVNFKDYHGNTQEAITKLLNDLKKFGSQAARNVKPEQLQAGHGEEVCHIVDELLNIELYRREYQFHPPVFPEEAEESGQLDDF